MADSPHPSPSPPKSVSSDTKPRAHLSLSIRTFVILLAVLPLVAVSIALVALLADTSARMSEQLGRQLGAAATERVRSEVSRYLSSAVTVSDLYERRVHDHVLSDANLDSWQRYLFDDLQAHPTVASICFADTHGNTVWLLRAHGRLEFGRSHGPGPTDTTEYEVSPAGTPAPTPIRSYAYNALQRPWYTRATTATEPTWTPIYFWFPGQRDDAVTGTGYTRAIRNPDGSLRGVLVVDVTLASLSDFLRGLTLARNGSLFLVDDAGLMVAASEDYPTGDDGTRLKLAAAPIPAAAPLAKLAATTPHSAVPADMPDLHISVAGQPALALISDLAPSPGLSWRLLISVPESAFLADAKSARNRGLLLAALATLGAITFALFFARRLSQPLVQLSRHIRKIGQGDFESRLSLTGAPQFVELSEALNHMSSGLRQRVELREAMSLATEVQQTFSTNKSRRGSLDVASFHSLPPSDNPTASFTESIDLGGEGVLIAVGTTSGDPVAAALLAVTARAALRGGVGSGSPLGAVMTKTNDLLAQANKETRLTTHTLLIVDPVLLRVRWSSSNPEAVLNFEPEFGTFIELTQDHTAISPSVKEFASDSVFAGSFLLLGTHALTNTLNPAGEPFGTDRLRDAIRRGPLTSAADLCNALKSAHDAFTQSQPPAHDLTLVVLKLPRSY